MNRNWLLSIILFLPLLPSGCLMTRALLNDPEEVTFYAAYGYRQGAEWVIPLRIHVWERNVRAESRIIGLARQIWNLLPEQTDTLRSRILEFSADSESGEKVVFVFEEDPGLKPYQLQSSAGEELRTTLNGIAEGEVRLPVTEAEQWIQNRLEEERKRGIISDSQNRGDKNGSENSFEKQEGIRLRIRAISPDHQGTGTVELIPPEGVSVISDIDDTIKLTGIGEGSEEIIRNTFFEPYHPVPGMADWYRDGMSADPSYHYISGSPWQLFRPLRRFLIGQEGFPQGSFHMKDLPKNLFAGNTWRALIEVASNENATYDQKYRQITTIMGHFPEREFILIGDSGEKDPELYRAIRDRHPEQIRLIIIRDTGGELKSNPERLAGLAVIPADPDSCPEDTICYLQQYGGSQVYEESQE